MRVVAVVLAVVATVSGGLLGNSNNNRQTDGGAFNAGNNGGSYGTGSSSGLSGNSGGLNSGSYGTNSGLNTGNAGGINSGSYGTGSSSGLNTGVNGGLNTGKSTGFGGNFNTGGSGGVDNFGSAVGGVSATGGLQQGTAQVQIRDQAAKRTNEQKLSARSNLDNADQAAARSDNQQRRGDLKEDNYRSQDSQAQSRASQSGKSYDQTQDQGRQNSQRQNDLNDKHGVQLNNVGRYDRQDWARNSGDKQLKANKNAFATVNLGVDNAGYNFKKNFATNQNEKGGFKDAVENINNNMDVYEEKQRDNRFSKGQLDAFRRSNDNDAFTKQSDWFSNAAQRQNVNNQFGAADRLKNAAEQQALDRNTLVDSKNDQFWHRDNAQDQAVRTANDEANKRANSEKKAIAEASGKKGVEDKKYYGGQTYGNGNVGPNAALGTAGSGGYASTGSGAGGSQGPVYNGGVVTGGNVAGVNGGVGKGTEEGSGGDYQNRYWEQARQGDKANQNHASNAQSDAAAYNNYNRGRGIDGSVSINGQREGQWAKDQAGLRDANSQGYNGANADVAKNAELGDNAKEARISNSNLESANKNLQAQELDRINWKRNQVDNKALLRKQKKFYHLKNEGGFNDEALNYNRNKGNQDWGEEQQAQKEARIRYNNAADDAKVNQQARSYNNLDARRISNADAVAKTKDNQGAWQNENRNSNDNASKNRAAIDNGRQNNEFDSFGRNVNQRNQQLWDSARKDASQRTRGSNKSRSLDGAFVFSPRNANNALGLGGSSQGGFGRSTGGGSGGRFQGGGGGSKFGGNVGGFMGDFGGSGKFGQTDFRNNNNNRY